METSESNPAQEPSSPGARLWLVSTPIGNLDDLSPRAAATLQQADLILCEDTRHSGRLLSRLGERPPLLSLHEHNEKARISQVLERLEQGQRLALISDAGTPLISDPGFTLVRAAIEAGFRVEAIPGASAVLTALVVSGLPAQPFTFFGFAPPKRGKRRTFFEIHRDLGHTLVFYESPHRIVHSLADALEILGALRRVAVARELTKLHEEIVRGTLAEVHQQFAQRASVKGEFVVVIGAERKRRAKDRVHPEATRQRTAGGS